MAQGKLEATVTRLREVMDTVAEKLDVIGIDYDGYSQQITIQIPPWQILEIDENPRVQPRSTRNYPVEFSTTLGGVKIIALLSNSECRQYCPGRRSAGL